MPTFRFPDTFKDHKQYVPLLKKALLQVKPDNQKKFLYFKEYPFGAKKLPLVLVDFDLNCPAALAKAGFKPTDEGMVSLTAQDELNFEPKKGNLKRVRLKKYFATMGGGIKPVFAPPGEVDEEVDPMLAAPAPAIAPAAPPQAAPLRPTTPAPALPGTPAMSPAMAKKMEFEQKQFELRAIAQSLKDLKPAYESLIPTAKNKTELETQWKAAFAALQAGDLEKGKTALAKLKTAIAQGMPSLPQTPPPPAAPQPATPPPAAPTVPKATAVSPQPPAAAPAAPPAPVDPDAPKWAKIDGVPDFFLHRANRWSNMEKLGEEATGLAKLIEQKLKGDKKALAKWKPTISALELMVPKLPGIDLEVRACEDGKNPAGEAGVKAQYKRFKDMEDQKVAFAAQIKTLWMKDQQKHLEKELKKNKNSNSAKMAASLGEEQFLEMAQMAEIMANKSSRVPGGFDPFTVSKKNQDRLLEPMELCEVAAIYGYSTQDFTTINAILRGSKKNPAEAAPATASTTPAKGKGKKGEPAGPAEHPDYRPYIESCINGLKKLTPYKGTAVRCDKTLHKSVVDELIKGGTRTERGFMSAGLTKVPGFGDVETRIDAIKTGKEITMLSLHDKEGEVLFPPGSVFRFVKYEADGIPAITDHKHLAGVVDDKTLKGTFWFTQTS